MADANEDNVTAHEPDRTLRELVGEDVKLTEIFTPEKIADSQKMVSDAGDTFFKTALAEMMKLDALLTKNLQLPDEKDRVLFDEIAAYVGDIKGQAEMLGFKLLVSISNTILDCCDSTVRPPPV